VRGGDRVTVLVPHCAGLAAGWDDGGVEVRSFRYAPERGELLGYGRSLLADETMRWRALAAAPLYAFAARRAARAEVRRRRYDLVHAHWLVPNGVALLGGVPAPLAIGVHGSDVFLAERRGLRTAAGRALARALLVTGCSPELVDRVCALGFPRSRARVIPYGVDAAAFTPDRERRSLWRRRLGVPADAVVALGVGRMVTKKGFQVLMRSLPELLAAHPDLHVVLAGDGDRLESLRAAAAAWPGRVHFPGLVLRDTLPDLYRAADLFVLPAVHDARGNVDGLPNVVLEAMASGLPVVATAVSGLPLVVEHEVHGLLVPEGDAAALGAAVAALAGDPARRARLGARARSRAATELTWDAVAARHRAAYAEALAGAAARAGES